MSLEVFPNLNDSKFKKGEWYQNIELGLSSIFFSEAKNSLFYSAQGSYPMPKLPLDIGKAGTAKH